MDWMTLFQDGNGIVAWGIAFLIAAGGTAVVMAFWWQYRKGMPWLRLLSKKAPQPIAHSTYAGPVAPPVQQEVQAREPIDPRQALNAYREIEKITPKPEPDVDEATLTDYLSRLHNAADRLEQLASDRKTSVQSNPDYGVL